MRVKFASLLAMVAFHAAADTNQNAMISASIQAPIASNVPPVTHTADSKTVSSAQQIQISKVPASTESAVKQIEITQGGKPVTQAAVKKKTKKHHLAKPEETNTKPNVINQKVTQEQKVQDNPFGITLYEPTYVLPFYYTFNPDNAVYQGDLPDGQKLDNTELNFQFSFRAPIATDFFKHTTSLNVAYSQISFWQAYNGSAFFRETNYEPSLFFETYVTNVGYDQWHLNLLDFGVMHQSNGLGGNLERSWNRAYLSASIANGGFVLRLRPWYVIPDNSLQDYNPNIANYLGYGDTLLIYKFQKAEISLLLRNEAESNFSRGAEEFTFSYPISKRFRLYMLGFSGYGQSLIEYNHYTNAVGIGVSVNDYV